MEKNITLNSSHHRFRQLDSLRGIAALAVYFSHYIGILPHRLTPHIISVTPVGMLFNGYAAVMFFFVLSGFVLSLPYVNHDKPISLTAFYIKRVFRIYPVLIFAIIFSVVIKLYLYDKEAMAASQIWFKSYWAWDWSTQNIHTIIRTFFLLGPNFNSRLIDPPVWSLVVEIQMSSLLPFFIRIASRNGVLLNIALLIVIGFLTYQSSNWALSVFYMGILMAKYKDVILSAMVNWNRWVLIAIATIAYIMYDNNYVFLYTYIKLSPDNKMLINLFGAFSSGVLMLIIMAQKNISRFLEHRVFIFMGNISYSFYLIHMPLLISFASIFTYRFVFSPGYIFLASVTTAVTISYLMFITIERPFQSIGKQIAAKFKMLNI